MIEKQVTIIEVGDKEISRYLLSCDTPGCKNKEVVGAQSIETIVDLSPRLIRWLVSEDGIALCRKCWPNIFVIEGDD